MAERPDVTVVVPTRNRWQLLLARALPSALEQAGVVLEMVVVDDGSDAPGPRDGVLADPRVRIVRRDRPGGMAAARNEGLEAARGRWVAFLDDDDFWSPDKLRSQLELAEAIGARWAYAGTIAVDGRGGALYPLYLPPAEEVQEKLRHACVIPAGPSNVVVETDLLRSLGGWDETYVHLSDWDLWLALADAGMPAVCEEILVAYMLHEGNIHARDDSSGEVEALVLKHARANPPKTITPDRIGYSRWIAGQRSRAGLHGAAAALYLRSGIRYRSPGNLLRAADALLAKRPSAAVRRLRRRPPRAPVVAPDWLRRFAT